MANSGSATTSSDRIHVEGLAVTAIIGVHAHERRFRQTLLIDVTFSTDAAAAGDDLAQATDYQAVAETISDFIREGEFQLIETAADRAARHVLQAFDLTDVTLTVAKPSALHEARNVSVTVTRKHPS